MKAALIVAMALIAAPMAGVREHSPQSKPKPVRLASIACFKTGEEVSGMNKICYYDCMGSQAAITIGAVEMCPLSIER